MFRNVLLISLFLGVNIPNILNQESILEDQIKYERVQDAIYKYDSMWENLCEKKKIQYPPKNLLIRVFKQQKRVELWASEDSGKLKYTLLKEYPICALSGSPGPKRKEGDKQIPEGLYYVELFNPVSKYHLSMKINYPNKSDKVLSNKLNPGSNIFFHGGCKTIGCIPLTDKFMSELYVISLKNYSRSRKIPVHIFPCEMEGVAYQKLISENKSLEPFWNSLEPVYNHFEKTQTMPKAVINSKGYYELPVSDLTTFN